MPFNNNSSSRTPSTGRSSRGGADPKAGSRSPKHRGYRAEDASVTAAAKKPRWSADDRRGRQDSAERRGGAAGAAGGGERRNEWYPKGERPGQGGARPAWSPERRGAGRPEQGGRFERSDRPQRPYGDRGQRPSYRDRPQRDDRAPRAYGDRPQRDDRAPRAYGDRPQRDDRAPRAYGDRPQRDDRAPRAYRDRPQRAYDDRPARTDEARPARSYGDRPARSFDDRPQRPFRDRDQRPAARSFRDRDERPARREFGAAATTRPVIAEDVVLERLEAQAVDATTVEVLTFGELGLGQNIVRELAEMGAVQPFPIQSATIPAALQGRDVLGRGRTGSGKTIAFGAPVVERLLRGNVGGTKRQLGRAPRALIMAPTRELALQIDRTVQPIARSVGLFTTQIYGGVPQARQVGALQRGVDIVIGTPGRIEDLIAQGRLDLSQIEVVVLDEADHMCDLGFLEPVQRIIRETADGGQRLLFSATLDSGVAMLVEEFLTEPAVYEVSGEDQASSTIEHRLFVVEQRDKIAMVEKLADRDGKTLVFARTRAFAEQLADILDDDGIPAVSLHGDLNQARRTRNLEKLTSGRVRVLVATDVAARGIHVDDIDLVIQADIPEDYKTYLHRSGRTGRAGRQGTVVTLVTKPRLRKIGELLRNAEIDAVEENVHPGSPAVLEIAGR